MKRRGFAAVALLCCALTVAGCGPLKLLGGLVSIVGGGNKTSTVATVVKILGSVLGQFYDTTTKSALVGSWTYEEPAIQFDSQNLLDQAGGVVASQAVADKLTPYYDMLGFKSGSLGLDLRDDNTCTYRIGGKEIDGTYDFDEETKKLSLKVGLIPLPAAYLSIVNNQMAMSYDSSVLLNIIKVIGSASKESTLASVSQLADSYDGMKTGFTFNRVKAK